LNRAARRANAERMNLEPEHTLSADEATLVARVKEGQLRAGARLMRLVDDRHPRAQALLKALHPFRRGARIIGITGNPGAGKSTLTSELIAAFRREGAKVGIIAVDPSSPFSGGAILGDRIRMNAHALDSGVFIRSTATRGHLGGLSGSAHDLVAVLDAMGFDPIFVETVGVGQDEVEVVRLAHTTVVVVVPGLGDDIQAIKAGLLEVADIFVINKADREGVERTERDLRTMQGLKASAGAGDVPVVRTVATSGEGVAALAAMLAARPVETEGPRALSRTRYVLEALVRERFAREFDRALAAHGGEALLAEVLRHAADPWTTAETLFESVRDGAS
jgi:LAO/AO transport system kinase